MNHRISSATTAGKFEYVYDIFGHQTSAWYTTQNFGFLGRIYWDNRQLAWRGANGATWFQHGNYLGTTRLRTDYQGHMAASEESGPFGEDLNQTAQESGGNQDAAQFTGLDSDSESGTSHAQFRQLSTVQGRWMSPDPYDGSYDLTNPQSLNRYSYVLNNPLRHTDRLGLDETDAPAGGDGDGDDGGGGGDGPIAVSCAPSDPNCNTTVHGNPPPTPTPVDPCDVFNCSPLGSNPSGPTGGGSNGGTAGSAPRNPSRIKCAANFGQAHSIGAAFGGGTIANCLGGNSVSSILTLFSNPPSILSGGLGLPVNDALRLTGGKPQPLYGSLAGTIRSSAIQGAVNSFLGTGDGIVSLSGEASIASFGGLATTAATAAQAASVVGIGKFVYDGLAVGYGYFFGCSR